MIRLIVAGSRDFVDYVLLKRELDKYLSSFSTDEVEIISGGAKGADKLGEQYAKENNYKLIVVKADWGKWGKSAGYRRNVEMANIASDLIAFHDGSSKGTGHMISIAKSKNLKVKVVNYET